MTDQATPTLRDRLKARRLHEERQTRALVRPETSSRGLPPLPDVLTRHADAMPCGIPVAAITAAHEVIKTAPEPPALTRDSRPPLAVVNHAPAATMFGSTLREMRERRRWSQAELGRRMKLGSDTVSKWESGRRTPDIASVRSLIVMLSLTDDDAIRLAASLVGLSPAPLDPRLATLNAALAEETLTDRSRAVIDDLIRVAVMVSEGGVG